MIVGLLRSTSILWPIHASPWTTIETQVRNTAQSCTKFDMKLVSIAISEIPNRIFILLQSFDENVSLTLELYFQKRYLRLYCIFISTYQNYINPRRKYVGSVTFSSGSLF